MTHRQIMEALTGLLAAFFTAIISSTIVANALPTIMSELKGTQTDFAWVITAALLANAATTPIWGKLADLFNKKVLVQLSIVIFVAGSVMAGLSETIPLLLTARVIQGIAMGGLTALAHGHHRLHHPAARPRQSTPATWAPSWPWAPPAARCSAASSSTARWAGAGPSSSASRSP